jgi:hypothetical protein
MLPITSHLVAAPDEPLPYRVLVRWGGDEADVPHWLRQRRSALTIAPGNPGRGS